MDISVDSLSWNGQPGYLPVPVERAPWNDLVSLRESRGDDFFVRKMTKTLKKNLPRFKKSQRKPWLSESFTIEPWSELTTEEESLRLFWTLCVNSPDSPKCVSAFQKWLDSRQTSHEFSLLECWYVLSALLLSGSQLSDEVFWKLWNLGANSFQSLADQLDPPEGTEGELDQFLIASVELRWLALAVYPEIDRASKLPKHARGAFSDWSDCYFPEDGIPDSEDLVRLPFVWRSLARSAAVCELIDEPLFRKRDHQSLRKLLTTTCRISGPSGTMTLTSAELPWSYLVQLGQQVTTKKQMGLINLLKKSASSKSGNFTGKVPAGKPSLQSDDSLWAVLRSAWKPKSDICVVRHHHQIAELNLTTETQELLSGNWRVELEIDGKDVPLEDAWEATCWHSDSDGDYLEMRLTIDDEISLDRQLFLSRNDHFLYLSEIANVPAEAKVTLRSNLPLADVLSPKQDRFTREWSFTKKKKIAARLFPLPFDQEIVHKTDGQISSNEEGITLERTSLGSLYLPMVLDWHPHRTVAPAEWRTLTVTQSRHISPAHQAGAYRLRLADQHLFMYRSLIKPYSPRAILGQHTLNESLIGVFDADGDVLPLLIVEE